MTTGDAAHTSIHQGIVPGYLLARLARSSQYEHAAAAARQTLIKGRPEYHSTLELSVDEHGDLVADIHAAPTRTIYDAHGTEQLPGDRVRGEDDPEVADAAVNQAFDGLGDTFRMLLGAFGRDSLDGAGAPLNATVHYGEKYDNAFWNGSQMVFGDGDGEVFTGFTGSVTVIGHELGHGVIQTTAGLQYQGQSGALNESCADVLGALTEQHALGQTADQASWLIGAGIFTDTVQGRALRDMLHPGTAYDDDELGRDPQPADMAGYVQTAEDNGGVHINSGIPNRAFALAAKAIGGNAWETAGPVWYRALIGGLPATAGFTEFAERTIAAAHGIGASVESAVRDAWIAVGVIEDAAARTTR
ncbi:M4 family metallopeptidase [Microbacterium sp. ARD32]|uniref:M4 family metallopeptidase n=1 Tax=Microbacterium sp. ARD32 TaxID=2962577 RepID=UPI002881C2F3|nr:M4 family metallopeptidase [Microbacterium sp. ARD32]MDT0156008.1 M4 family metallopeptidase [Microbacterium sp. ARD32]